MTGLSIDADIAADENLLGKVVADLQEDVEIGEYGVSGTLKYVTGYTGFSGDAAEQSGNYLILHFEVESEDDAVIKVGLTKGKTQGLKTLDADGLMIFRLERADQEIIVEASLAGYKTITKHIPIHGLVLETEA